jgi:uncharacterized repeat protein (TIGR03803 family)
MIVCASASASCSPHANSPALPSTAARFASTSAYRLLYSFAGPPSDGASPEGRLLADGSDLYGATSNGGKNGAGAIFAVNRSGQERMLFSFPDSANGKTPESGLIRADGALYGTTSRGGGTDCPGGCGTLYSVTASGRERVVYNFTGSVDGQTPLAPVVSLNSELYGTTLRGGCGNSYCVGSSCNCGTAFVITPSGQERFLHRFQGGTSDGEFPETGLTLADGVFYGTTRYNVFKLTPSGKFAVLYAFRAHGDGTRPEGDLLFLNGALYGTTFIGGGTGCGGNGCGIVFKLTTSGRERILYRFKGGADGSNPSAGVIAFNGTLLGTTTFGGGCAHGRAGCGTIFSVDAMTGVERVLYRFKGGDDGAQPGRGQLMNLNGTIYGTTQLGGAKNRGTVFSFVPSAD